MYYIVEYKITRLYGHKMSMLLGKKWDLCESISLQTFSPIAPKTPERALNPQLEKFLEIRNLCDTNIMDLVAHPDGRLTVYL